jgi:neutral ceramidase
MLNVGFADTCITPPLGYEIPGLFGKRHAKGVHDDLFVRAAVIDDGVRMRAFVQVDAIAVGEATVAAARKEAQRLCGIAPRDCLIAATHTHSGGPTADCLLSEADPAYQASLARGIASAIAEAYRRRGFALAGVNRAAAPGVAFNRRFRMKDGTYRAHPGKLHPDIVEPAGPADPTVTVFGFRSPDNEQPFGAVVHFACHATHMNGLLYSADYPAWIVSTLRAVHGPDFGVVFLNGACGDVTQVDNLSGRPAEFGPYWCRRTGEAVGAAALQALATCNYFLRASIDARTTGVRIPVRSVTPEECRKARALLKRRTPAEDDVEAIYAREALLVDALRRKTPAVRLEIQAVRIADTVLWSVPGELFQTYARRVEEASPFPRTCCVSLANGYAGYICTPETFAGTGYESRTARSSFLAPEAGDRVAAAATKLCRLLYAAGKEEVDSAATRVARIGGDESALAGLRQAERRRAERADA